MRHQGAKTYFFKKKFLLFCARDPLLPNKFRASWWRRRRKQAPHASERRKKRFKLFFSLVYAKNTAPPNKFRVKLKD